ncbi:MAG: hypothetical protein DI538_01950 [Azospira oryzae]|nr:MAG: hypothetical protein DI538_01950 [Azospira oryzae]
MRFALKGLLVIILLFLFIKCNQQEYRQEFYDNGAIKTKSEIAHGIKNGIEYIYSPEGETVAIHHYQDDSLSGTSSFYKKDGMLYLQITYSKGVKEGSYRIYYQNGNIGEAGTFHQNKKRGTRFIFYEKDSGKVKTEFYTLGSHNLHKDGYFEYDYYSKEYNRQGELINQKQVFLVLLPNDTLSPGAEIKVKFKFDRQIGQIDSAIVVLGDFEDALAIWLPHDTIDMKTGESETTLTFTKRGSQFVRGHWVLYQKETGKDSTLEKARVGLFEEKIVVND